MNLYWNLAKGTTAKAQGTTATDVGAVGYSEYSFRMHVLGKLIEEEGMF